MNDPPSGDDSFGVLETKKVTHDVDSNHTILKACDIGIENMPHRGSVPTPKLKQTLSSRECAGICYMDQ